MYDRNELQFLGSFTTILRMLKNNPSFNRYCTQHRIAKGHVLHLTGDDRKTCYLVESGYLQYTYKGDFANGYFYFVRPGKFIALPLFKDQVHATADVVARTEVIWWKIDFEFLRQILLLEDPKNYVILNYTLEIAYHFFMMSQKYLSTAQNKIYFCLIRISESSLQFKENQVELPLFITYDQLATISNVSKGYTANIVTELRNEGILDSSKKPWIITDVARLKSKLGVIDRYRL
ncbi:Crp/Fnr family transcriptional regulator [Listeria weihenstephanensis]|uniref:Crp/Fnr family transcriptional regulator n=1 Tax=Listeria weihenstephanensis TaxID=1006155 RepID=A0A841Z7W6_9LIST|nr:Crp/Fnr family transcriptional regulator [Listeria weihenstephanensis]MBC1501310.1 Crp/Fnr family transcriptional regulator [Listeria weihenstephanensis]